MILRALWKERKIAHRTSAEGCVRGFFVWSIAAPRRRCVPDRSVVLGERMGHENPPGENFGAMCGLKKFAAIVFQYLFFNCTC